MAVALSSQHRFFGSSQQGITHDTRRRPLTPPMEKSASQKPSLPSITSLIQDVDKKNENSVNTSPISEHQRRISAGSHAQPVSPTRRSMAASPHNGFPPTPPLVSSSQFFPSRIHTGPVSPSVNSVGHNGYFGPANPNIHPDLQGPPRSAYPPIPEGSNWNTPTSLPSPRRTSGGSITSDIHKSEVSNYADPHAQQQYPGLTQQRPLPSDFPPQIQVSLSIQQAPLDLHMTPQPQYQHHHHYPMMSAGIPQQLTDRYVCTICQKAFSRPSSLKIHTYSHTGEKPFKCKYEGCGKFFSVRSNMKRHEKGCHAGGDGSSTIASPKPLMV